MQYILVDSASDIQTDNKENYMHVPITITLAGRDYKDGENIDKETFYRLLRKSENFPKTSQPSPDVFFEIFQRVKKEKSSLVYLALSSMLSGTYQSAMIAKQMVEYNDIYIVDTRTLTYGIALLAQIAEKLRSGGKTAREIAETIEGIKGNTRIVAGVDTLEYLYKGGRLSRASAAVGTVANIKPVLTISKAGTVSVIGKSLGKARAMASIIKFLKDNPADPDYPFYTIFTFGEENTAELESKLPDNINFSRVQIGSTIGAHAGPGAYGLIYMAK